MQYDKLKIKIIFFIFEKPTTARHDEIPDINSSLVPSMPRRLGAVVWNGRGGLVFDHERYGK